MDEFRKLLEQFLNRELKQMILSNSRDAEKGTKVKIRPVLLKGELVFQETLYLGKQVFHENFPKPDMIERIVDYMDKLFKQCECRLPDKEATVLVSKKGKMTIKVRNILASDNACQNNLLEHNRPKQYILQEGQPVDFLVGLGVQTPDGKITKARYDKFRQINRYLEFIEDVLEQLPTNRTIKIIDFGCGKSYLTFAMYYYLHELQHRDIEVTGLDLKADAVDMVVSLHACDTATDYALEKAIRWGATVIMAVPCCQHEVNKQIRNEVLRPILKYGLLKERLSALVTDAVRANLLEQCGYETQILEFIDMEHTPKNILIRAVKRGKMQPAGKQSSLENLTEFLQISPTLEKLLAEPPEKAE